MIEVKHVKKKYKKVKALDDVSFNIEEGKITCILGVNGVGKSTILKVIAGLVKPNSGEILIDGEKFSQQTYNKLAFVTDIDIHFNHLNIKETFDLMKLFYKNWDEERAYEMLRMFSLTDDKKISELSKGNKARVKIIIGFAQRAKYILLDEPFSGIDIFKREEFINAMLTLMEDDESIVITTHEIGEIEQIVDDVIILNNGKIEQIFNAEEVRQNEGKSILDKMREVYNGE
ncbi:MAG: ABC transporter ATP-binding protein [Terrisporobacter othiniensis]|uniref:ABC transporter ATP-binding protein n=1 Tax=Terrisporobacter petrolearius TaxID=1460447 RepID=UPI0022DFF823|nr:ABC transporter ATP-binding protein [Terrisporobacter petrolearius]MDU4862518.1 ABC transporter ATP-binding protein [Terrisporobacter othiniensis]MDU6996159.1 ABC transporter ATP-binding protein [Terrisporobacter othiniensis]